MYHGTQDQQEYSNHPHRAPLLIGTLEMHPAYHVRHVGCWLRHLVLASRRLRVYQSTRISHTIEALQTLAALCQLQDPRIGRYANSHGTPSASPSGEIEFQVFSKTTAMIPRVLKLATTCLPGKYALCV